MSLSPGLSAACFCGAIARLNARLNAAVGAVWGPMPDREGSLSPWWERVRVYGRDGGRSCCLRQPVKGALASVARTENAAIDHQYGRLWFGRDLITVTFDGAMTAQRYRVIIEGDETTNYSAYSPDIPGVVATGATREECEREIREAIKFHLEGLDQDDA
jgi:predicted RNase H-like HicB family nuclease